MIARVLTKRGLRDFFRLPRSIQITVLRHFLYRVAGSRSSDSATIWASFYYFTLEQEVMVTELADGYQVRFNYQGRSLMVVLRKGKSSDVFVFFQVFIRHEYDALFYRIRAGTQPVRFCLDGGAKIGFFSIALCCQVANVQIVAIEPEEDCFKLLVRNLLLNGLDSQVHAMKAALWVKQENVFVADREGQEWAFRVTNVGPHADAVHGVSLSFILTEQGWTDVDLVKLDIEGSEGVLFRDESFLRSLYRIPILAMEIHEQRVNRESIHVQLASKGYTFFETGELTIAEKALAV